MLELKRINCTKLIQAKSINLDAMVELTYEQFCQEEYDTVYWVERPVTVRECPKIIDRMYTRCSSDVVKYGLALYGDVIVAREVAFASMLKGVQVCAKVTVENSIAMQRVCDYIYTANSKRSYGLVGS